MDDFERLGVIGHPVSHSLSPLLHSFFMSRIGIRGKYFRATGISLSKTVAMLKQLEISKFNVTHPYKEQIRGLLSSVSPDAVKIGAVNTVIDAPDTGRIGLNTDHYGVRSPLSRQQVQPIPGVGGKNILIFGAGGAARAAAFALEKFPVNIYLCNRTRGKGQQIARAFSVHFIPLEEINSFLAGMDVIVWTIPGHPDTFNLPLSHRQLVFDANYTPPPRDDYFGSATRIDGLNWLVYQGWESFSRFFPAVDCRRQKQSASDLTTAALNLLRGHKNNRQQVTRIALIGFMGAGKTSIGRELANQLHWDFIDTDDLCQNVAGKSVSDIFREFGEQHFRNLESEQIGKALNRDYVVIALGGGALLDSRNFNLLKKNAFVIWLFQPEAVIEKRCRVAPSSRPLYTSASFRDLMKMREERYLSASDLIFNSIGGDVSECAKFLKSEFQFLY